MPTRNQSPAVKREEKRLRAKLQLRQGEDDLEEDEDEADEEDDEEDAGWGIRKRAYYDADEVRRQPCIPCRVSRPGAGRQPSQ